MGKFGMSVFGSHTGELSFAGSGNRKKEMEDDLFVFK